DDLPAPLRPKEAAAPSGETRDRSLKDARDNFERSFILAELKTNDWNMTRTADRLGIERSHLYRKLKAYNINPPKRDTERASPGSGRPSTNTRVRNERPPSASAISASTFPRGSTPRPSGT